MALPVTVDGSLVGVMLLTQPLRDIDTVLGDLRLRWAWSTAIALLLSGAVGLLLSAAVTRPVQRLTTAAASVGVNQPVQIPPSRMIGAMSGTTASAKLFVAVAMVGNGWRG